MLFTIKKPQNKNFLDLRWGPIDPKHKKKLPIFAELDKAVKYKKEYKVVLFKKKHFLFKLKQWSFFFFLNKTFTPQKTYLYWNTHYHLPLLWKIFQKIQFNTKLIKKKTIEYGEISNHHIVFKKIIHKYLNNNDYKTELKYSINKPNNFFLIYPTITKLWPELKNKNFPSLALTLPTEHKNITFPFPIYILNNKTQLIFKNYLTKLLTTNNYINPNLKKKTSQMSLFKFQKFNNLIFHKKLHALKKTPKLMYKKNYSYFSILSYKQTKKFKIKKKRIFPKLNPPKLTILKNETKNSIKYVAPIKRYSYFLSLNKLTKLKQLKLYKKNFFKFERQEDVVIQKKKRLKNKYNTYYNTHLNTNKKKIITFFKKKYHYYYKNYIRYLEGLHLQNKKKDFWKIRYFNIKKFKYFISMYNAHQLLNQYTALKKKMIIKGKKKKILPEIVNYSIIWRLNSDWLKLEETKYRLKKIQIQKKKKKRKKKKFSPIAYQLNQFKYITKNFYLLKPTRRRAAF